jgi:hypothetical protein
MIVASLMVNFFAPREQAQRNQEVQLKRLILP